jgi:hypothetical protein
MSGHQERVRRLEKLVPERTERNSPTAAWAAILAGNGNPGLVAVACRPHLGKLRTKMLGYGRYAMQNPRPVSLPYFGLALAPLRVLAEIIACPPREPVPEQLLRWRRRPLFYPDYWQRRGTRYRDLYTEWIQTEIAWLISPELEAIHLRQRLHAGKLPALPELVHFDASTTLGEWPDGLFILVEACCQTERGGHPWTKVDTP